MRQRLAVLTDQQREEILQQEDKLVIQGQRIYSLTTFCTPV